MFHKIDKDKPSQDVLEQIIDNIRTGKLKPGDVLPTERKMSEMMQTSRPVIREGLKALECEAAALAALNCTAVDAAELHLMIERLYASSQENERDRLDHELHMKIAKMTGNAMIYSVLAASAQLTETMISGIRNYMMQEYHSVQEIERQHRELIDAITRKDAISAKFVMQKHMDTIEKYILKIAEDVNSNSNV